ncbi:hypothetical protein ABTC37_19960, partial [Acinetobacter baumannii]
FPSIELENATSSIPLTSYMDTLLFDLKSSKPLSPVKHSFTRYRATLFPYFCEVTKKNPVEGHFWILKEDLKRYAFNSGHKKIVYQI